MHDPIGQQASLQAGAALHAIVHPICILDRSGNISDVNAAWIQFGLENGAQVKPKQDANNYLAVCDRAAQAGATEAASMAEGIRSVISGENRSFSLEYPCHGPHQRRWFRATVSGFTDQSGSVVILHEDITAQRLAEFERHETEARFRLMASAAPVMVWTAGTDKFCDWFNDGWLTFTGRTMDQETGNKWAENVHPDDLQACWQTYSTNFDARSAFTMEYRMRRRDGEYRWILDNGVPRLDQEGIFAGYIGSCIDVTDLKVAEDRIRKLSLVVEQSPENILITNLKAEIEYANPAFLNQTGYTLEDVVGRNPKILNSGLTPKHVYEALWATLSQGLTWEGEFINRRKDGTDYIEHAIITPIRLKDGKITHYVAIKEDITAKKKSEEEINALAFYDPLTELPNRRLLYDRMRQALAYSDRSSRHGALLFIDLDNFKTLNDSLGHDQGDQLLRQVAGRLVGCVRAGDTVARIGGDEFVLVLEELSEDSDEAITQVEMISAKIIDVFHQPYLLSASTQHVTPSIGATLFCGHECTIEELMRRADLAMYRAKSAGRNTMRFFDPEMQAVIARRAMLELELRNGIEGENFTVFYQPQYLGDGRLVGAEALVRWDHPTNGIVMPGEFIPIAEDTGLILNLGFWVLESVCAQLKLWADDATRAQYSISVNVSPVQFSHPEFVREVLYTVKRHGINPRRLKMELTEGAMLKDVDETISKMNALRAIGIGFSIDDFGTGFSSLSYMKRLPLEQIKIDKSFVSGIPYDSSDNAIAKMIIALADTMGLEVIAEGVEREAQMEFLTQSGCQTYQGYLFGKPMPLAQFQGLGDQIQIA